MAFCQWDANALVALSSGLLHRCMPARAEIFHKKHELTRVHRRFGEVKLLVKSCRRIVDRVYQHGPCFYGIACR
jgi:hypothetical protein